jgi:hypothetical protein
VLIKALMRSAKKPLQETAFEILRSLPKLGIHPGAEVYNQIFEYYATVHDYRQTKAVLRMMAQAKPRVRLDAVSYGHLIQVRASPSPCVLNPPLYSTPIPYTEYCVLNPSHLYFISIKPTPSILYLSIKPIPIPSLYESDPVLR